MEKKKAKIVVPHVYILLIGLILLCSVLSYVVPAGQYDMIEVNGREIVDSATYHAVEQTPVSLMQFLTAIPRGMQQSAQIILWVVHLRFCRKRVRLRQELEGC